MSEQAVYAYGIVAGASPDALASPPAGVPGGSAPRLLSVSRGLDLVVSDVELGAWSEAAIAAGLRDLDWVSERALRHDAVISHLLEGATVLPMKAFTIFRNDARARAHVRDRERDVRATIERVSGCLEWGVRFRFDESAAKAAAERASRAERPASGAAFLARKKGLLEAGRSARAAASEAATGAIDRLVAVARASRPIPAPEGVSTALLAEIALLVPRDASAELERVAESLGGELAPRSIDLELTGPWAPFHFAAAAGARP